MQLSVNKYFCLTKRVPLQRAQLCLVDFVIVHELPFIITGLPFFFEIGGS